MSNLVPGGNVMLTKDILEQVAAMRVDQGDDLAPRAKLMELLDAIGLRSLATRAVCEYSKTLDSFSSNRAMYAQIRVAEDAYRRVADFTAKTQERKRASYNDVKAIEYLCAHVIQHVEQSGGSITKTAILMPKDPEVEEAPKEEE